MTPPEHLLEHLLPDERLLRLRETWRVLEPGAVYRAVVPDAARFFQHYLEGNEAFFRLAFPWAERPMQAIWHIVSWGGAHRNVRDFAEIEHMGRKAGFTEVRPSEANGSAIPELRIDKLGPQRVAESL